MHFSLPNTLLLHRNRDNRTAEKASSTVSLHAVPFVIWPTGAAFFFLVTCGARVTCRASCWCPRRRSPRESAGSSPSPDPRRSSLRRNARRWRNKCRTCRTACKRRWTPRHSSPGKRRKRSAGWARWVHTGGPRSTGEKNAEKMSRNGQKLVEIGFTRAQSARQNRENVKTSYQNNLPWIRHFVQ